MKRCLLLLPAALGACAHPSSTLQPTAPPVTGPYLHGQVQIDSHVPPFAVGGWAPFTRDAVVAIALREWRLWGNPIDDAPPETRPPPLPQDKPERQQGLWQRVGEYWWEGQDPGTREAAFTGAHDENGAIFPAPQDGDFAWSAAFVSYVMRIAGAGNRFAYSPNHSTYINAAAANATPAVHALPPQAYAPQPGDLICTGRATAASIRFADLPTPGSFPSHCDIVVAAGPGNLTVIGGNVDDAVTEKHVPVTASGTLSGPDGVPIDTRYNWFVVLRVDYDTSPAPAQT